ncbi:lipopolysaccharide biosynthesis protein [Arachidicoccus ginsenosidivorans]|uniref:lipopolysaccharide biosynthesis protein n=1 Tax=Arachidicoccus ginsenosidivorans TaxID=496057 RepID=UPI0013153E3D|nr:lipopolysaccharide biosynthesis protein [Arachidicoccus ginsenosidivorans]
MSLKKKAINGIAWTFGQQVSVQAINFLIQIVLARILVPEMFGIIALLQVFIAVGNSLLDGGMTSSLIRTKSPTQSDYSTVFIMNLAFSVAIYIIVFCISPLVAKFYHQNILKSIIRIYTLGFIIQALVAVQTTKLTVELNFKLQMLMELPAIIIGGIVGVVLAEFGYGVWSLVYLYLIRTSVFMLLHWFWSNWRPNLSAFKFERFKFHFHFGYKLTLSSLITNIYLNIYPLIIGKYFTITQLGYYQQANSISYFPVSNFSAALSKVTFPLFTSINEDLIKVRQLFLKFSMLTFFITCPIMFILSLNSQMLFRVVLTDKWAQSAPYFKFLSLGYIFYPFSLFSMSILLSKGRSDLHFKAEVIKKTISLIMVIGLVVAYRNMWAIIIGAIFSLLLFSFVNSVFCCRLINLSLLKLFKSILPPFLYCIIAYFIVQYGLDYLSVRYLILGIIVNSLSFLIIYFILCYIFKNKSLEYCVIQIKSFIKNKK